MYSHIQSTYAVVQGRELISSAALVAFSVLSNTCPQRPFANSVDCSVAVRWTNDDWKISTRHAWREVIQNMIITLAVNVTECGDIVALGICSERFGQREYIQTPIIVDWPFGNKARQNDKFEIAGPAYNAPGNPLYVALDISPEGTMSASLIQIIPPWYCISEPIAQHTQIRTFHQRPESKGNRGLHPPIHPNPLLLFDSCPNIPKLPSSPDFWAYVIRILIDFDNILNPERKIGFIPHSYQVASIRN